MIDLNPLDATLEKTNNAIRILSNLNDEDGSFTGTKDQGIAMAQAQALIAIACALTAILEKMK